MRLAKASILTVTTCMTKIKIRVKMQIKRGHEAARPAVLNGFLPQTLASLPAIMEKCREPPIKDAQRGH